jgi:hypothetical protein
VWIYGSPRTGSTWLLEMLCHPLKVDPHEDVGFRWREGWEGPARALPVDEFRISSHLEPVGNTIETEDGMILSETLNGFGKSFSSYAFSAAYEDVWRPEARRLTLVRLHAVVERSRQAGLELPDDLPLLVIKEVNSSHAAPLVMSLFPRSRMIFLVRDGRDVIDSLIDASSPSGWLMEERATPRFETPEERLGWVRQRCLDWTAGMNVCTRAYEAHDPALRRRVRYEDLLADTTGCLRDLAGWLGLPNGPRRLETVAGHHSFEAVPEARKGPGKIRRSATPGRWREALTPQEQELAQDIMGRRLVELGYEP